MHCRGVLFRRSTDEHRAVSFNNLWFSHISFIKNTREKHSIDLPGFVVGRDTEINVLTQVTKFWRVKLISLCINWVNNIRASHYWKNWILSLFKGNNALNQRSYARQHNGILWLNHQMHTADTDFQVISSQRDCLCAHAQKATSVLVAILKKDGNFFQLRIICSKTINREADIKDR